MKNLLSYLTPDVKKWLSNKIENPGVHDMPTMESVVDYLKSTYDTEPSEEVMGDLIIQFLHGEGLMFDFC